MERKNNNNKNNIEWDDYDFQKELKMFEWHRQQYATEIDYGKKVIGIYILFELSSKTEKKMDKNKLW